VAVAQEDHRALAGVDSHSGASTNTCARW